MSAHVVEIPTPWKTYKADNKVIYRNDLMYLYADKNAKLTARAAADYYKTVAVLYGQHVERYEINVLDGPYITDTKLCYVVHPIQTATPHTLQEIFEPTDEQIESRRLNILVNKAITTSSTNCGYDLNER